MPRLPRISDAEWEVMRVVWERAPVTAADVVRELVPRTGWNHRTVRTMLGRLARKGALSLKEQGNRYLYSPKVKREQCVRAETRSFVDRVFRGHAAPLLFHFVEEGEFSRSELDELRQLLEEKLERTEEDR